MSVSRRHRLVAELSASASDCILISNQVDVRWLTGFTGSNGALLLTGDRAELITDGRYTTQAAQEAQSVGVQIESGDAFNAAIKRLETANSDRLFVQKDTISANSAVMIGNSLSGFEIVDVGPVLSVMRAGKSEKEVNLIRRALSITEQVFSEIIPLIKEGISENDLAAEIDYRQRLHGASSSSFETIVAFGENSALPHAQPGARTLVSGSPVLLDFGCVVEGYASDMTRMVYFGNPTADFQRAYSAVHTAFLRSVDSIHSGMSGQEADSVARQVLQAEGYGRMFTHSLGHGVGLDIHEWPSLSSRNSAPLPEKCVVTIEPGVYLPSAFGIRIENMVYLTNTGAESLNQLPTELIVV